MKAGLDTPEFAVGDEVLAYARKDFVHGGTLAELVEVPVRTAAHKPSGLSFEEAAALPLTGLTALQTRATLGPRRRLHRPGARRCRWGRIVRHPAGGDGRRSRRRHGGGVQPRLPARAGRRADRLR